MLYPIELGVLRINDSSLLILVRPARAAAAAGGLLHAENDRVKEIQLTDRAGGHILTNIGVWSPDGEWIVYDTRSDLAGATFDGETIEMVHVRTREVRELYRARNGAHCGVATFSPASDRVAFILGPEHPTTDWQYGPSHRQGVVVDLAKPGHAVPLDARDVVPPYTSGALRGGTHVHVFSGDGKWVSFTYEDAVLSNGQRNVGVCELSQLVRVPKTHPRNHDGSAFSVLVTRTVDAPQPSSDEISRAVEDAWVGTNGYFRPDGKHQHRAIAFQGQIVTSAGRTISEAFAVELPDDLTRASDWPLAGTPSTPPAPPHGTVQRRLTFTHDRKYPGLQGPRHWLRSSPDGTRIAFLMRDDAGVVQLWSVSPNGDAPQQITRNPFDVASAFSWSPDGGSIAHVADQSVFVTHVTTSKSERLTVRRDANFAPRPEACVFSPDGTMVAYVRPVERDGATWNQIFVVKLPGERPAAM